MPDLLFGFVRRFALLVMSHHEVFDRGVETRVLLGGELFVRHFELIGVDPKTAADWAWLKEVPQTYYLLLII